ncbi:LytTR family transcriptional regulator DNA-binding domain-containing protein [Paenibacillus sp. Leaf72]|uniref:LytTR family transcriptional regulator DNA-binding domain-containing protein n=1 Tax=Paenibacillus sp. Leaf72 TaxID=1736234 RepID=UPI0006F6DA08|nr:LytTR family transcriptional regulator DNA-binding domain-containing protein [Paenibacillus sp. Leaf72]KQN96987.1 hypothetical protein ASF12_23245 [Paenibacillus sp. Leaf72]
MSNRIFVLREKGRGNYVPYFLEMDEIIFCSFATAKVLIHTSTEVFLFPHNVTHFEYIEGFVKTDRPFVVNWKHVKGYDEKWSQLSFNNSTDLVNVSGKHKRKIKELIIELQKILEDTPNE